MRGRRPGGQHQGTPGAFHCPWSTPDEALAEFLSLSVFSEWHGLPDELLHSFGSRTASVRPGRSQCCFECTVREVAYEPASYRCVELILNLELAINRVLGTASAQHLALVGPREVFDPLPWRETKRCSFRVY